ncbi:hypothetical protein FPZ43_11580 [Mucilaginibacter pallidiroseus]|uniref:Uncharacterized protein n=1 Tax=Mucilaginibacter pallidiroseus TaxID=2599295 RepID=A0A563UCB8_9SPHI|nr:hypothetical protein [Mucilaginibacter pallidiroseus]TWR28899.1 hypothetical protein FPZ43_11580 [Mucilaginibacter pallidiroseus]
MTNKIKVLVVLLVAVSIACNSSQQAKIPTPSKADTVVLKGSGVIFIAPGEESIKALKRKHGKSFYTIADDANAYFAEASGYLDSLKVLYKNYDDSKIIVYDNKNTVSKIPRHASPW